MSDIFPFLPSILLLFFLGVQSYYLLLDIAFIPKAFCIAPWVVVTTVSLDKVPLFQPVLGIVSFAELGGRF